MIFCAPKWRSHMSTFLFWRTWNSRKSNFSRSTFRYGLDLKVDEFYAERCPAQPFAPQVFYACWECEGCCLDCGWGGVSQEKATEGGCSRVRQNSKLSHTKKPFRSDNPEYLLQTSTYISNHYHEDQTNVYRKDLSKIIDSFFTNYPAVTNQP